MRYRNKDFNIYHLPKEAVCKLQDKLISVEMWKAIKSETIPNICKNKSQKESYLLFVKYALPLIEGNNNIWISNLFPVYVENMVKDKIPYQKIENTMRYILLLPKDANKIVKKRLLKPKDRNNGSFLSRVSCSRISIAKMS